jgi:hypothetical protein
VQESMGGVFDPDYLVACLLQATFLVVRCNNGKAKGLFPLVSVLLTFICFVTKCWIPAVKIGTCEQDG